MSDLEVDFICLTETNVSELKFINNVIFPIKYKDTVYQQMVACGDVSQLAYYRGTLVGAIGCNLENTPEGVKLYIITLGVLAPYRNMGIGGKLLERCMLVVLKSLPEVVEAYLHVHTANDEAITFYQKYGFETSEVIHGYYKRLEPPNAVILKKRLQPRVSAVVD